MYKEHLLTKFLNQAKAIGNISFTPGLQEMNTILSPWEERLLT